MSKKYIIGVSSGCFTDIKEFDDLKVAQDYFDGLVKEDPHENANVYFAEVIKKLEVRFTEDDEIIKTVEETNK